MAPYSIPIDSEPTLAFFVLRRFEGKSLPLSPELKVLHCDDRSMRDECLWALIDSSLKHLAQLKDALIAWANPPETSLLVDTKTAAADAVRYAPSHHPTSRSIIIP
jgi:hypothetical protein